jgi:hypothetical protein
MAANTTLRTASLPPPGGRVRRPVTARPRANPRSHEEIIADAKKRYADALAYLVSGPVIEPVWLSAETVIYRVVVQTF